LRNSLRRHALSQDPYAHANFLLRNRLSLLEVLKVLDIVGELVVDVELVRVPS
jgi:hypothetical protein